MARKFRKKVILAKVETTYATDATPTGAANAILTKELAIQPMQGSTVNRDVDRPTLGRDLTYHVGPHTVVTFKVEMAGSGAAGTAPAWGVLLRGCAMAETIDAGVSVAYAPVSGTMDSLTLYYFQDGILHALLGARGTVKIMASPGELPYLEFTFTGLRVAPSATALPTPDFTAFQTPLAVNNANTPTFSLHSYAPNMQGFELDLANTVTYRNVVGEESVQIVDRDTNGSVTIEEPALGDKDYHAIIAAHTTGALSLTHGTAAGHIVEIAAPAVQLLQPRTGETDGIVTLQMNTAFVPVAGDDELTITAK